MPRVALYQPGNIMPQGPTDARVRAADFGSAGEIIGGALKSVGGAVSDYVDRQAEINDIQDRAAVKDAANVVAEHYNEIGFTGPNAYFSKQGKDALTDRPMVESSLDALIKQKQGELKTEHQRQLFNDAIIPQRQAWGAQIAQHSATETRQYDIDESASRVDLSGNLARNTYISDPEHGEAQIATGVDEIKNLAKLQGWGPDTTADKALKFTSGTYHDIGVELAHSDPVNGPSLAEAFVEKHQGSMTGDDRLAVLDHARTARAAYEAEQRRIEADARREAREQKTDARDRAESIYRNIQDGVVVDPKTLASAMGDARTAGDDGLIEGIRQGGLKNSLTQQYANATPAELQSRVNELSAQITKAGGKVEPDLIVERDHLQKMASNSRTALNSDPLSWGAEHLGISLKPLNLNDAASVTARIQAATIIANRTGTSPRPLQQDEVAASQQVLQHGSTQDKVGLALRLAKLGPLALPAAEQLTNNPAYINIIGLATHSNKGVAASRVTQILTGYDALKTKPKLLDKNMAQQQFNEYVGTSLQFLPQVRDGVFSNAAALLANQANENGHSEWGELGTRDWFKAVNSALGAYSRDGKQVGGLAKFNGGITVLPENMSLDEFETKIAKSNGPEFRAAQNGVPHFADGRTPSATDLKRMQWVPSGDNVYRLSDGNGFLKTNDGFYEVDVSKLSGLDAQLAAHGYKRY